MASETREWPKREDGSNMTIGEMTLDDRRAQMAAANFRVMNPVRCSACRTDGFQYTCEDCWEAAL